MRTESTRTSGNFFKMFFLNTIESKFTDTMNMLLLKKMKDRN